MSEKQKLFRRVFESIAAGRSRQAQRFVTTYLRSHGVVRPGKD